MTRVNRSALAHAHAPLYPKPVEEAWIVALGDVDSEELLALKRIAPIKKTTHATLAFTAPDVSYDARLLYKYDGHRHHAAWSTR